MIFNKVYETFRNIIQKDKREPQSNEVQQIKSNECLVWMPPV